mgnify:CR=1 FL=1|tara:strand:- start:133 stop:312 length:180 start_codon:yes stop_codon:yes gene_type:complete
MNDYYFKKYLKYKKKYFLTKKIMNQIEKKSKFEEIFEISKYEFINLEKTDADLDGKLIL